MSCAALFRFLLFTSVSIACIAFAIPARASQKLTLDDFITRTIHNNPTVRSYIEQHVEAEGTEYASRGIDDVNFDSLFSLAKKENPQITGLESTEDKSIAYRVGVSKLISQSGTRLGASYQNTWMRSNYPAFIQLFGPINPIYTPSVTLSLTQPLLKNFMGRQDQLNKRLARIGVKLAKVQYEENVETFISEMTQLYLSWLRAYNDSRLLRQIYNKITEQVKLIREQVEAKVSEDSDLYRILEQQANYKALWEGAMAQFEGYTHEVAAMMEPDYPPKNIIPTSTSRSFLTNFRARSEGLNYLKTRSRLREILDYTLESEDEVLKADKNARLPDLDLSVGYSRTGAASSFGRAHGSTFNNDDISGGLSLSVPITNRAARGQYRAQQAKLARVEYDNERTMLNATSKLEALYDQERRLAKQVKAYEAQVHYGNKKVREERKQYDDGRLSLFQLLQDVSTLINQSLDLETSRVFLAQTRLLIGELTDVNLEDFRNAIDDIVTEEE